MIEKSSEVTGTEMEDDDYGYVVAYKYANTIFIVPRFDTELGASEWVELQTKFYDIMHPSTPELRRDYKVCKLVPVEEV